MSEQLPPVASEDPTTLSEAIAEAPAAQSPNEELAARVAAALMAANLLPAIYQEQCETLLAEGKATNAHWTTFLEKPADTSTPVSATSHD